MDSDKYYRYYRYMQRYRNSLKSTEEEALQLKRDVRICTEEIERLRVLLQAFRRDQVDTKRLLALPGAVSAAKEGASIEFASNMHHAQDAGYCSNATLVATEQETAQATAGRSAYDAKENSQDAAPQLTLTLNGEYQPEVDGGIAGPVAAGNADIASNQIAAGGLKGARPAPNSREPAVYHQSACTGSINETSHTEGIAERGPAAPAPPAMAAASADTTAGAITAAISPGDVRPAETDATGVPLRPLKRQRLCSPHMPALQGPFDPDLTQITPQPKSAHPWQPQQQQQSGSVSASVSASLEPRAAGSAEMSTAAAVSRTRPPPRRQPVVRRGWRRVVRSSAPDPLLSQVRRPPCHPPPPSPLRPGPPGRGHVRSLPPPWHGGRVVLQW